MERVAQLLAALAGRGVRLSIEDGRLECYAPKGALTTDLKAAITLHRSALLSLLDARSHPAVPSVVAGLKESRTETMPLPIGAQGLYILQQLEPDSSAYNIPLCIRFLGHVDATVLGRAWAIVNDRHPILRSRVEEDQGVPTLIVDEACRTVVGHGSLPAGDEREMLSSLRRHARRPFDLRCGPLVRIDLFRQDDQCSMLLVTVHHAIFDGTSGVLLLKMLLGLYRQLLVGTPILPTPASSGYADFVSWERDMLASEGGASDARYWRRQLEGMPTHFQLLPGVTNSGNSTRTDESTLTDVLPQDVSEWLRTFASARGVTMSAALLAAFAVLLHRFSGEKDLIVGMPVSMRRKQRFATDLGYFINMVPLRIRIDDRNTFARLLQTVQNMMVDSLYHSDYPYARMMEDWQSRPTDGNSIFQISYANQDFLHPGEFARGVGEHGPETEYIGSVVQEGDSNLGLLVFDGGSSVVLQMNFNPLKYEPDTVARFFDNYRQLLVAIRENRDEIISDIDFLTMAEERRLVVDLNNTRVLLPTGKCIHHLFLERVEQYPDRVALASGDQTLSYRELNERSQSLALYLQSKNVSAGDIVGLCTDRSFDMIVGLLGILQAGAGVLPLDPEYPLDRLSYMLRDSETRLVLSQAKFMALLETVATAQTELVALDQSRSSIELDVTQLKARRVALIESASVSDLAYVIYTSGSTGHPKGVLVEHGSLVNHNIYARKQYRVTADDSQVQFSSISFDLFMEEVFTILNSGAKLILAPKDETLSLHSLEALIEKHELTILNVPTAFFHELAVSRIRLSSIKCVIVGGEKLDYTKARKFIDRHPGIVLHNTYGPTETTIMSTAIHVTRDVLEGRESVPIGRPIDNTQVHILDRNRKLQPMGIPGELYIAGDGLARGYLNRPDLTQERFVSNPFAPGTRMYRTGDLARWLDDGNIEYLGRIDTQVKIRGFRIELEEIETWLCQHPLIENAVVVALGEQGNKHLIAFYRVREGSDAQDAQLMPMQLKGYLRKTLPDYMIPAGFECIETIPMTPSGKLDRRALERIDVQLESSHGYLAARTPTERRLVEIWAQVLQRAPESIGVNDNFFELGGHSLLATKLLMQIRTCFEVDLPLRALFERTSIAELSVSILHAAGNDIPTISVVDRSGNLPLSFSQERLWFIQQLEPDSVAYHVAGAARILGALEVDDLDRAFVRIIDRHESLRTVFPSHDGQPYQKIIAGIDFRLQRYDLEGSSVETCECFAKTHCDAEAAKPFDLASGPLIRGLVIRFGATDHLLMLNMHHIVGDGWSIGVLINELGAMLDGRLESLPQLPIQYADYSVWQRLWLEESGTLHRQLQYWQEALTGMPETLELATDYPRPGVPNHAGATHVFLIDARLTGRLRALADQNGCTLFMVLLAAVNSLLYRYTGQEDFCIGTPIANRQYGETENLIGMFVNTLALRTKVCGAETFIDLLASVKRTCVDAYEHQDTPFEKIVEVMRPRRNMAISPLFQVMVMLQNMENGTIDRNVQPYPLEKKISKFDLSVEFTETLDGLTGAIEYSTDLYRAERIDRMIVHFMGLLDAIVSEPMKKIDEYDYLDNEGRRLLIDFGVGHARYSDSDVPVFLHRRFESQAATTPDAVAVECDGEEVSYSALNSRANRIAHALLALNVSPDDRVGICMDRSIGMVAGLLGILKAGCAYVPLDPAYPPDRLAYMLEDSAPKLVLSQTLLREVMPETAVPILWLDDASELDAQPAYDPDPAAIGLGPKNLAYLIYTSGSTGRPKGVMIEHSALANYLTWAVRTYTDNGQPCDSIVSSPISFDATVTSVYLPLLTGGRAVLLRAGDELTGLEILLRSGRHWGLMKITPLHWRELGHRMAVDNVHCRVDRFIVGGEALSWSTVKLWCDISPQARFINEYGPTETVVGCTIYEAMDDGQDSVDVPIGRPIDNTQIYILDRNFSLQPAGIPGELYIAGDGLARGYLNRPELTQERFVTNPFVPGTRMYRTGDLARWLEDGNIEYLGRIDTQVKIRGFRIELGEIEAWLCQHPLIESAVVVARGEQENRQLIGFYLLRAGCDPRDTQLSQVLLKEYLQQTLPDYMIPAGFACLSAIPLTPSGKVDRRVLERMDVGIESSQGYMAARTPTEQRLVEIWAQVLQRAPESIGVHDNFFEIGGHSLMAVRIMAKTKERFGRVVPLSALFAAPTIGEFADLISDRRAWISGIVVPIESRGALPPLFAVPGAGGNMLSFHALSNALGPDQPFYGLQAVGLDGENPPFESVEATAAANIAAIKKIQSRGPYRLIGHSYGGVVAFEMARMLLEQGEAVAYLALLDSISPQVMRALGVEDEATYLSELLASLSELDGTGLSVSNVEIRQKNASELAEMLAEIEIRIGQEQFQSLYGVYQANRRCYARYEPAKLQWDIEVLLCRATKQDQAADSWPPDYGWSDVLQRQPQMLDVDATHFSMLDASHVPALAEMLRKADLPPADTGISDT